MSIGDGVIWNESLPDNSTLAHQIDDYNRDLRVGVRSRMAREHMWPSAQTGTSEGGQHNYITFQQQTAAPSLGVVGSTSTQVGAIFVGSSGDGYPLCFENSAGTTFPIIQAVSSAGTFSYGMAIVSGGTLGSIPICSSASPTTLAVLTGPTSTTATTWVLMSSNNSTGGVQAPAWVEFGVSGISKMLNYSTSGSWAADTEYTVTHSLSSTNLHITIMAKTAGGSWVIPSTLNEPDDDRAWEGLVVSNIDSTSFKFFIYERVATSPNGGFIVGTFQANVLAIV